MTDAFVPPSPQVSDAQDLRPSVDAHAGDRRLVPWRRAPFPAPWVTWFGREAPLHLEIGFGDGRYTIRRALDEPNADFVGIEVSSVSVRRAVAKLRHHDLQNVRLVKGGAQIAVRQLFAPASLSSVTVNFPDPWPKDRHEDKRLLRVPFLTMLAGRLVPGGEIRLATDHPEYLTFSEAEVRASGWYAIEAREAPPAVFETKYATKWKEQGKPLHYRVFVRNDEPVPDIAPIGRPDIMPHALLQGSLPTTLTFEKVVNPVEEGHVILHDVAQRVDTDDTLWIRATVDEPDVTQQLLLVVQRRTEDWIVRVASFGDPLITPAVRGAVHAATEWLASLGTFDVTARNY